MPLIRPLHPGQRLGDHELTLSLAEGPLATTWRAQGPSGTVALKTIAVVNLDDPDMEDAFVAQTALASKITHPGVARLLASGQQDGYLFAAFAWIDGRPLGSLLRSAGRDPLPPDVALRVALDLCEATAALHADGLVHRALSPANIVVTDAGATVLLDVGVGAVLSRSSSSTTFRHMVGKFSYLSPEQLWSRPVDARSDVFSIGLLCGELLAGQHPFRGRHERETTANILSPTTAPALDAAAARLPPAVLAWLRRAMAKNPLERFADAGALRDALLEALAGGALLASADEVSEAVRRRFPVARPSLPGPTELPVPLPPAPLPSSLTRLVASADPAPRPGGAVWVGVAGVVGLLGLLGWHFLR